MKIFVFGSNLRGVHGAGAAKFAKLHRGAVYGQAVGRQGNSYAIPTKDKFLRTLSLDIIKSYVDEFLLYALNSTECFELTPIGCGLAGLSPEDVAPMFKDAPSNVELPRSFKECLNRNPSSSRTLISVLQQLEKTS